MWLIFLRETGIYMLAIDPQRVQLGLWVVLCFLSLLIAAEQVI